MSATEKKADAQPVTSPKTQESKQEPVAEDGTPSPMRAAKEEVVEVVMGEDEFYAEDHVEKPKLDSALSNRSMEFYACLGQSSFKRYNFHWLGDSDFAYVTGNTYQIYNVVSGKRQVFHGTDVDGVGSIAVHPSRKYFAVAEKGPMPNIYIYEYPSLRLYRVCRKGTELMYAHVEFSTSGKTLASLGGAPDYTLTVWDWLTQKVVLKAKAFGQDVFRVSFSPYTDDILFTCGTTHIKFWKMAQTFTGLKLQGEIAKFGQLELSDISSFQELPDGKVVSGTDYGNLIVWEGQFVKAQIMLDVEKQTPLHKGMIEVLLQDDEYFITAGADGYVKWWRMADIDAAEAEEGVDVALAPVKEILIAENEHGDNPAYIVTMILANNKWYIQDANGRIYVMDHDSEIYREITQFHKGAINDIVCSPSHNYAVSLGEDGLIKVWDYANRTDPYRGLFSGGGTCLEHMPHTDVNKGRICAVGFDNGIVRMISVTADGIVLLKAFKAHEDAVKRIKFSKDLKMVVTASVTGDVFFFEMDGHHDVQKFEPLCTLRLPDEAGINDFKWNPDQDSVIFGCNTGYCYQIPRPVPSEIDNSDSYYWHDAEIKTWRIKIMEFQMEKNQKKDEAEEERKRRMRLRGELPAEEDEPEEDWDPEPIRTILPFTTREGDMQFIVSSEGKFNGWIYLCSVDVERPVKAVEIKPGVMVTRMEWLSSKAGELLAISYDDGDIELVVDFNFDRRMSVKYHDAHIGQVTAFALNKEENFFLSAGRDGLIYVHLFDKICAIEESKFDPLGTVEGANFMPSEEKAEVRNRKLKEYQSSHQPVFPAIDENVMLDEAALAISIKSTEPTGIDILDPDTYSIQQSKLRTEEDHRMSLAEKKKSKVRQMIEGLRKEFLVVAGKNTGAEEHLQLTEDDFQIDPEFFQVLYERNEAKIEETKKEVAYDIEWHTVFLNKLKNKYYDVLEFEKFMVKGIKNGAYVTTFRVQRMSPFLQTNIEAFKQMLENEIIGKDADADDDFLDDNSKDENQVDENKQKEKDKTAALAAKQKAAQQAALNAKKTEAEKYREMRKLAREDRKRKIEHLEKKEAVHSNEDPEDKKEIEIAQATYGDYKLKQSVDYTVPENQRVNFSKKRQQMVLLEGSIHKLKVDFNQKIQELKIRKKGITDDVIYLNKRLTQIDEELGEKEELFEPVIDKDDEYPENYFEISEKDIADHKQAKLDAKNKAEQDAQRARGRAKGKPVEVAQAEAQEEEEEDAEEKAETARSVALIDKRCLARKGAKVQATDLDTEYAQIRRIELIYEKEMKKKEIQDIIQAFDEEIREMQKEKYRLESDLKNAEMKLILFYEELIFLKSMEDKDIALTKRLASCRQEKGQILKEINEISRKLKDKKKEIDEIKEKEEELMVRFHELCPERSDKYEEIMKFFQKIIKRRRKVEKPDKGEDDEDEDEEVEDEEDVEEDEDEDEDENTIQGLTNEEYKIEDIERLRDERLDLFEDKEKIQTFIQELDVQRKRLENKEKAIKAELEETEEEIQDFQSEKMSKLNQLQASVVLKVKQVQNLVRDDQAAEGWAQRRDEEINQKIEQLNNKATQEGMDDPGYLEQQKEQLLSEEDWRGHFMPADLKKSVLFTRTQLLQLINRKRVLDEEQVDLHKSFREFKRDFNQKRREIKENEKTRELREREYNERQMLRFGNLVDLDNLEVSGPSAAVVDLQTRFTKTEKRCIKMIEEAEAQFEQTQRELTANMKNNTMLLTMIRELGEQELDLDKKLNDSNKAIFVDEDDEKKRHILQEKLKIKKLLEIQAKEIETFKTEINMYKRKGGHIYTKVTTNRRVANLNQDN